MKSRSLHEAADGYLETCARLGQQPNKPYSGKLLIRVNAEIHMLLSPPQAAATRKSLNHLAAETLNKAVPA